MDLQLAGLAPSAVEQAALDDLLGRPLGAENWRGNGALGQRRHLLLPALHAVHDAVGWISRGAVDEIARRLEVAPADVYGVASFYGLFSLTERPPRVLHVCTDLACQAGAASLTEALRERCGPPGHGDTWPACAGGAATWAESPCLGVCEPGAGGAGDPVRRGPRRSGDCPGWLGRGPRRAGERAGGGGGRTAGGGGRAPGRGGFRRSFWTDGCRK
jgi:NADH-quinone oxidoreductase subunit F